MTMLDLRPGSLDLHTFGGNDHSVVLTWPSDVSGRTWSAVADIEGVTTSLTVVVSTVTMTITLSDAVTSAVVNGRSRWSLLETTGLGVQTVISGGLFATEQGSARPSTSASVTLGTGSVTVNTTGLNGAGVPIGGTAGQALVKTSGVNYAAAWVDIGTQIELDAEAAARIAGDAANAAALTAHLDDAVDAHDASAISFAGVGTNNFRAGVGALAAATAGAQNNVALGNGAMEFGTTPAQSDAIGYRALRSATSGPNTAIGYSALTALTSGNHNVAIGLGALDQATTANGNVAIGIYAGDSLNGDSNTALGYYAMRYATTAANNVAIGSSALRGASLGVPATGTANVAIGTQAMFTATSAQDNVAIGNSAFGNATTGSGNVAIGSSALVGGTTAASNVAIGNGAMQNATTAGSSVAIGTTAAQAIGSATSVTAIGFAALVSSTGAGNTAVGANAGGSNVAGIYNTFVGTNAGQTDGVTPTSAGLLFATAIGVSAQVTANNVMALGASIASQRVSVCIGNRGDTGGGLGLISLTNATTVPTSNPTGGGLIYTEGGALKYRGSSGTVTTLAAA